MDAYEVSIELYDDEEHGREWYSEAMMHGRAVDYGTYSLEIWRVKGGVIHRDGDSPALIARNIETGEVVAEGWYANGKLHRDGDMPAAIWMTGFLHREWYKNGLHHRSGAPAILVTTPDGPHRERTYQEVWCQHGQRHRVGGPAELQISDETGVVMSEGWYRDGKFHRVDGPASIARNEETGVAYDESWRQHGQEYRADGGPTFIKRHEKTGEIRSVRIAAPAPPTEPPHP